jgi:hypothetical protein
MISLSRIAGATMFLLMVMLEPMKAEASDSIPSDTIFGKGLGGNWEFADMEALDNLIDAAAWEMMGNSGPVMPDSLMRNGIDFRAVANTYSAHIRTLSESEIQQQNDGSYLCIRRMAISDVALMLEERMEKVQSYLTIGRKAEKELRLENATQYYFWSWLLMHTLPEETDLSGIEEEYVDFSGQIINGFRRIKDSTLVVVEHYADTAGKVVLLCSAISRDNLPADIGLILYQEGLWEQTLHLVNGKAEANCSGLRPDLAVSWRLDLDFSELADNDADLQSIYQEMAISELINELNARIISTEEEVLPSESETVKGQQPIVRNEDIGKPQKTNPGTIDKTVSAQSDELREKVLEKLELLNDAMREKRLLSAYHLFSPEGFYSFASLVRHGQPILDESWRNFDLSRRGASIHASPFPIKIYYANSDTSVQYSLHLFLSDEYRIEQIGLSIHPLLEHSLNLSKDVEGSVVEDVIRFMQDYQMAVSCADSLYFITMFEPYLPFVRMRSRAPGMLAKESQQLTFADYQNEMISCFDNQEYHHFTLEQAWIHRLKDGENYALLWYETLSVPGSKTSVYRLFMLSFDPFHQPKLTIMAEESEKTNIPGVFGLKSFNYR